MNEFANQQISSHATIMKRENIIRPDSPGIAENQRSSGGCGDALEEYKDGAAGSLIIEGLLQASFDAVYVLDAQGGLLDLNETACLSLGSKRGELLGRVLWDVVPEDALQSWQSRIGNVLATGKAVRFEDQLNGCSTESSVTPVYGDDGLPASLIVVSRTITEARQLEEQLRRCEKVFASAQRMAKVGSWDVDFSAAKTQWSDELYRMLGYAPGDIEPTVDFFAGHIHPDDLEQFLNRSTKHGVGDYNLLGTQAEYRLVARDGSLKWVLGNTEAEYDDEGNISRISGTVQDITDRRQMEEVLRGSEEKFRSLFMGSGEGIVLYDHQWRIIGWNKAMERITGRAEQDFIGRHAWDMAYEFLPPDKKMPSLLDMLRAQHTTFLSQQESADGEFTMFVGCGAFRVISYNTFKIPAGAQLMYGSILRDITDHKTAEIEREKLIAELTDALAQIKTLKGLIPICSTCKKIRDDKGYWNAIEQYIMEHSEAEFTHGICPDCIRKYFPEAFEDE